MKYCLAKKLFSLLCLSIFWGSKGNAQALQTGDKMPDIVLQQVWKYKTSSLKLSEFKGKLVILDFWGLHCTSCVAAFPKIDSLQRKFKDIQIILVNKENELATKAFFAKTHRIKMPGVPMIVGDSLLHQLFPHISVPHHIWIDKTGVVRYIFADNNTNEETITAFLNGQRLDHLNTKRDTRNVNYDVPLIAEGNGRWFNQTVYYSYLMHAIDSLSPRDGYDRDPTTKEFIKITKGNTSIGELYKTAFKEPGNNDFSYAGTFEINDADSNNIRWAADRTHFDQWEKDYRFSYEIGLPNNKGSRIFDFMKQDLERYFGFKGKVEKRIVPCYVLVRKDTTVDLMKSKGGKPFLSFRKAPYDSLYVIHNRPLSTIFPTYSPYKAGVTKRGYIPLFNETGYNGNVDLSFSADAFYPDMDIHLLQLEVNKYGLDIQLSKREMSVLVIEKDK